MMLEDKNNELLNNPKLYLHIAMKKEVVFTACGFFRLDYTLVHSMIAATTTYLVILIQFGQMRRTVPIPNLPASNTTGQFNASNYFHHS
ncbi:unnamed protein product [Nezara viridula]|uniref:Gustatory receptor n=1 Tax=Nezara viridula TaxID=85310 RepID=A0A9P0H965_NEZVI|nr:unnamed protein product [Nezara viridula]